MSEPQSEYSTDIDDTQPTPGPWENNEQYIIKPPSDSGPMIQIADTGKASLRGNRLTVAEAKANARLIAAAGTAASELPDQYDPIASVKGLAQLVTAAEEGSHRKVQAILSAMKKSE